MEEGRGTRASMQGFETRSFCVSKDVCAFEGLCLRFTAHFVQEWILVLLMGSPTPGQSPPPDLLGCPLGNN